MAAGSSWEARKEQGSDEKFEVWGGKGFLSPKGLPQVAGGKGLPQPPFLRQKSTFLPTMTLERCVVS